MKEINYKKIFEDCKKYEKENPEFKKRIDNFFARAEVQTTKESNNKSKVCWIGGI